MRKREAGSLQHNTANGRAKVGWTLPFVSSRGTTFSDDCGVDRLLFANNILDLAPYGRQEDWEDSPAGWPQHPTYG